jgi:hypothetical protein
LSFSKKKFAKNANFFFDRNIIRTCFGTCIATCVGTRVGTCIRTCVRRPRQPSRKTFNDFSKTFVDYPANVFFYAPTLGHKNNSQYMPGTKHTKWIERGLLLLAILFTITALLLLLL